MSTRVIKRSLSIAGHRTSISLEEAFWQELRRLAEQKNLGIAAYVAMIDASRRNTNLSSAIRVHVLEMLKATSPIAPDPAMADKTGGAPSGD